MKIFEGDDLPVGFQAWGFAEIHARVLHLCVHSAEIICEQKMPNVAASLSSDAIV